MLTSPECERCLSGRATRDYETLKHGRAYLCASCINKDEFFIYQPLKTGIKMTTKKKASPAKKAPAKSKAKPKPKAAAKPRAKAKPKPKAPPKAETSPPASTELLEDASQELKTVSAYDDFRAKINEVKSLCDFLPATSTDEGYAASKEVSLAVGKVLKNLEDRRKDLKAESLKKGRAIDTEAKGIAEELAAFQEPHKTAFKRVDELAKTKEAERIAELTERVRFIRELPQLLADSDSEGVKAALDDLIKNECHDFYDFTEAALLARNSSRDLLSMMFTNKLSQEKDARELEVLRIQQAAQTTATSTAAVAANTAEQVQQAAANATAAAEQKQAEETAATELAAQQRANDIAHVSKVRGDAKDALIKLGLGVDQAKKIVLAINKKEVPNVSINY